MTKEEVIQHIKDWNLDNDKMEILSVIIPELKENEDEKIRKEIMNYCYERLNTTYGALPNIESIKKWLAWLEKQEEQKSADKVEPKFKVGDWVIYVCGEYSATLQIKNIVDGTYEFTDDSTLNVVDENTLRLWTIQDAKDGDVLASDNGCPFVYKKSDGTGARLYCCVSIANNFCIDDGIIHCGSKNSAKPATKEQRDLLFTKMKDDGYEWDAEKKELRKIEQKSDWSEEDEKIFVSIIEDVMPCGECPDYPTDEEREYFYEGNRKVDWLKSLKEKVQPQPKWSEEDEGKLKAVCTYIQDYPRLSKITDIKRFNEYADWLKALKEKVQPQPKWSEEDEEHFNSIIESYKYLLRDYKACHDADYIPDASDTLIRNVADDVNFLKSLKERVQPQPKQELSEDIVNECVDLGLPSGTLWEPFNEEGYYTYDEAVEKFGDNLPTKEQWEELKNECNWKWKGNGYDVTGPNGNMIFLPAAGYRYGTEVNYLEGSGFYWSGTCRDKDVAWYAYFVDDDIIVSHYLRAFGLTVRLVK